MKKSPNLIFCHAFWEGHWCLTKSPNFISNYLVVSKKVWRFRHIFGASSKKLKFTKSFIFFFLEIPSQNIWILTQHKFFLFQDRAVNELEIGKEDAKYLLSIVGIANTIGRVVLGFIADRPWVNRLYLYNTSLAICGLCKYLMLHIFWEGHIIWTHFY